MWGDEVREAMERFPDVVHVLERSIKKCEANCRSAIRAKPEDVVGWRLAGRQEWRSKCFERIQLLRLQS
jgi:hypothetical protein